LAGDFSKFVKENGRLVQIALAVGAGITALGVALTTAGFAAMGMSAGLAAIGGVLAALASPLALVAGGLAAVVAFGPQIASGLTSAFGSAGALIGNTANTIAGPLRQAVADASIVLGDMGATAKTTFQGISDAITAGNLSGAMDMLWAGLYAGWLRGVEALMSQVDPWVAFLQNTFTYLGTNIATTWEAMWSGLAQGFNTAKAVIMGIMDNLINGVMAAFDAMVSAVKKSWNWVQSFIVKGYDLAEENRKVDTEMAARAQQRGQQRPGVTGRMAAAASENAQTAAGAQQRIDAMNANADATAAGRFQRNDERAAARREATIAAESRVNELASQFADEAAKVVEEQAAKATTGDRPQMGDLSAAVGGSQADVAGTFSAAAVGGLGIGQSLAQKQLEELKGIHQELKNMEGGAVGD